jgi:hypothetical protein
MGKQRLSEVGQSAVLPSSHESYDAEDRGWIGGADSSIGNGNGRVGLGAWWDVGEVGDWNEVSRWGGRSD